MHFKILTLAALAFFVVAEDKPTTTTPAPASKTPAPAPSGGKKNEEKHDDYGKHEEKHDDYGKHEEKHDDYGKHEEKHNDYGHNDYGRHDSYVPPKKYDDGMYHPEKYPGDNGMYHPEKYGGSYGYGGDNYGDYSDYRHGYLWRRGYGDDYGYNSYGKQEEKHASYVPPKKTYDDGMYHPEKYPGDSGMYHPPYPGDSGYHRGGSSSYGYLLRRGNDDDSYKPPQKPYSPPEKPYSPPEKPYSPPEKPYSPPEDSYKPSKGCVDGQFKCSSGSSKFYKCDHGHWVSFECAPGTVCYPDTPSPHVILCDYRRGY